MASDNASGSPSRRPTKVQVRRVVGRATLPLVRWRRSVLFALLSVIFWPGAALGGAVRADRDRDKVFDDLEPRSSGIGAAPGPRVAARTGERGAGAAHRARGRRARVTSRACAWSTRSRRGRRPRQIRALARRPDVAHVEDDAMAVAVRRQRAGVVRDRPRPRGPSRPRRARARRRGHRHRDRHRDAGPGRRARCSAFKDLVNGRDRAPYDDIDHGSLVAEHPGRHRRQRARGARRRPGRLLWSRSRSSTPPRRAAWARSPRASSGSVEHRALYGIDAINLSLGDPNGCGDGTDVASQAVDAAVAAGIVVVAAAGNSGPDALHDQVARRGGVGADRRRDGRHRRRRLLRRLVLEPRPDRRRPDQAGHLRARASTS